MRGCKHTDQVADTTLDSRYQRKHKSTDPGMGNVVHAAPLSEMNDTTPRRDGCG